MGRQEKINFRNEILQNLYRCSILNKVRCDGLFACHKCDKCGEDIYAGLLSGYVHIRCKNCGNTYRLTQRSMKIYMVVPLCSVAVTVAMSICFLQGASIDIKTAFILGISWMLVFISGLLLIHADLLVYETGSDKR